MSTITNTPLPSRSIIGPSSGVCLEPSPASTYGSSITGDVDDTPQTPNDSRLISLLSNLYLQLRYFNFI